MSSFTDARIVFAALFAGIALAGLSATIIVPAPRLAARVRPYTLAARTRLGKSADVVVADSGSIRGGALWRLWSPPLRSLAQWLKRFRTSDADVALAKKLRQAGYAIGVDEFRIRQIATTAAWTIGAGLVGYLALRGPVWMLAFALGGFAFGFTRLGARLDNDLESRRSRMRIELYTVNMQLAMHVRTSPGLVKHIARLVRRGRGEIVGELRDVLSWVNSGASVADSFARIAELTPEPWAARTYRLLAIADERGADLADGLLALSEDIRDNRREDMRRAAVKRTGAMLLPTIGILAPIMLLFIAAPLPQLIFGVQ